MITGKKKKLQIYKISKNLRILGLSFGLKLINLNV